MYCETKKGNCSYLALLYGAKETGLLAGIDGNSAFAEAYKSTAEIWIENATTGCRSDACGVLARGVLSSLQNETLINYLAAASKEE